MQISRAQQLLQYKSEDLEKDFVFEISEVLSITEDAAQNLVTTVMEMDKSGTEVQYPKGLDRSWYMLIIFVTQPLRIPKMLLRMNDVLEEFGPGGNEKTVLDYGGGGGKDSILYARAGYKVTYCDLIGGLTPLVQKRFKIRGLDQIEMYDVRELPNERFDIINCMDVIEHVYDVEFVLADIAARIKLGGHLVCYPAFFNSWDGDHVEKNCGYGAYFIKMMEKIGFRLVTDLSKKSFIEFILTKIGIGWYSIPVLNFVRERPVLESIESERQEIRLELYRLSKKFSIRTALISFFYFPFVFISSKMAIGHFRQEGKKAVEAMFSNLIDNISVWRLSNHRLNESKKNLSTHIIH